MLNDLASIRPQFDELGISTRALEILVVRSTENWLASYIKYRREKYFRETGCLLDISEIIQAVEIYKEYLIECLNEQSRFTIISYDAWFSDKIYRMKIGASLQLELDPTDEKINHLSHHGGGSSFDGMSFLNEPKSMRVLERWKNMREDPDYLSILKDEELLRLTSAVFKGYTRIYEV
jgi:hypothetical protein